MLWILPAHEHVGRWNFAAFRLATHSVAVCAPGRSFEAVVAGDDPPPRPGGDRGSTPRADKAPSSRATRVSSSDNRRLDSSSRTQPVSAVETHATNSTIIGIALCGPRITDSGLFDLEEFTMKRGSEDRRNRTSIVHVSYHDKLRDKTSGKAAYFGTVNGTVRFAQSGRRSG